MTDPVTYTEADFRPDAYAIRTCGPNGESYGDFRWPLTVGAYVAAPDWAPTVECGNGLHGLPDGIGDWGLVDGREGMAVWQIVGYRRSESIDLDGKVKFPRCRVVYSGGMAGAKRTIITRMAEAIGLLAKGNTATGYSGHAAATGDSGHAAATGDRGHAAATGDRGHAAATGDRGHAAATGYSGHAAATGDRGHAAATGDRGHAAATGDSGHAAATGYSGHAAATGYSGHAAATGHSGHAAATGKHAIAAALGYAAMASAGAEGWIVLAYWDDDLVLRHVRAAKVGGPEGVKPNVTYRLSADGAFEEVAR